MTGTVVTFYSTEWSAARALAVDGVAERLFKFGARVLVVDWDETNDDPVGQDGSVAGLIESFRRGDPVSPIRRGRLQRLPAGLLRPFDWANLYAEHNLGDFLEERRADWVAAYDFVLINSSSGQSGAAAICTAHLADRLIFVHTPDESLADIVNLVARMATARDRMPYDRPQLTTLPLLLPASLTAHGQWLAENADAFAQLTRNWLHRDIAPATAHRMLVRQPTTQRVLDVVASLVDSGFVLTSTMMATTGRQAIVVVDVTSLADPANTLAHLDAIQKGFYEMLRAAFDEAGISWESCYVEDRADGAMILVPPDYPMVWLADQWQGRLLSSLRRYNAVHTEQAQVQLRVALHHGEVDDQVPGLSQAVILAFRILGANAAKNAQAATGETLALVASDDFYRDVVAQEPAAEPASYRRIVVSAKKNEIVAWLRLPGTSQRPPQQAETMPSPVSDIVNALLELPFMRDADGRTALIDLLPAEIAQSLPFHTFAQVHIMALVQTCLRHEGGLTALVEAARQLDGDSQAVRRLEEVAPLA